MAKTSRAMNMPPPRRTASPKAVQTLTLEIDAPKSAKTRKKRSDIQRGELTAAIPKPNAQFASLVSCNSFGREGAE